MTDSALFSYGNADKPSIDWDSDSCPLPGTHSRVGAISVPNLPPDCPPNFPTKRSADVRANFRANDRRRSNDRDLTAAGLR